MKKVKYLAALLVFAAGTSAAYAEGSYIGLAIGIQFDLGQLGGTIAKDGLDAGDNFPQGNRCNPTAVLSNSCLIQGVGTQQLIVPENRLIALEANTLGAVRSTTNGPMQGAHLGLFYESEGESTFWRVGIGHTRKVMGGESSSTLLKGTGLDYTWYDIKWDFYAWFIPAIWGIKAGVGESASVYGGLGINYAWGGWSLGGINDGDALNNALAQNAGIRTSIDSTGALSSVPVAYESVKFRVKSILPTFLIGFDKKLENGDKIFFEIEYVTAGGYDTAGVKSEGGARGLAPWATYPVVLGGTQYKFGYKMAL
jgi:hypothetical protein